MSKYVLAGCILWGSAASCLYLFRPRGILHRTALNHQNRLLLGVRCFTALLCVLCCILPMNLSPVWNGERPTNRNQYELTAEAFLNGRLSMDYPVDPRLAEMENPYDPAERERLGVYFQWDHAFYNGHYYMYFGVVPVILLFLPFRVLTGRGLTTYHATQVFVAAFILGVFALFRILAEAFFPDLPLSVYLTLSLAVSVLSVWHSVAAPALYCTAVTSGLCMEIWSLYFYVRAVFGERSERRAIRLAFFGALFGALAFGCRPPIALANVLVLPLLECFLRSRTVNFSLLARLFCAASPYLIVGALLMAYNYARFDNPFEFGQSWQLTAADQSGYAHMLDRLDWRREFDGFLYFTLWSPERRGPLALGAFVTFPVLLLSLLVLDRRVHEEAQRLDLVPFLAVLYALPLLIIFLHVLWTPVLGPRSRMDVYWVFGLMTYLAVGLRERAGGVGNSFRCAVCLASLAAVGVSAALFLWPNDSNYTDYYWIGTALLRGIPTFGLWR